MEKPSAVDFLTLFLANPATTIPKGAQWAILFDDLKGILGTITQAYKQEPNSSKWKTSSAASAILNEKFQTSKGCMFCQAIGLPGDGTEAIVEGNIKSNNFIRSYVGAGRSDFPIMRMTFLDTNVSFADSFLRGWSLATATYGLLARDDVKYRTNLTCFKYTTSPEGLMPLMTMTFHDICCISVSEEEYQYTPPSAPVLREARFVYTDYSVDTITDSLISKQTQKGLDTLRARGRD